MANIAFRPVRCLESALETMTPIDGHVVFTTDTKKIYAAIDGEFKMMGGSSGVFYGTRELTDDEKYGDEVFFTFLPEHIDGNTMPTVDDLILNIPDGGFYRVLESDETIIQAQRLAISGGGGGTGGGPSNEGSLVINYITPQNSSTITGVDYYIDFEIVAKDSAGDLIGDKGVATWKIGTKQIIEEVSNGKNSFKVDEYLDPTQSSTKITLVVSMNTGGSANTIVSKTWYVKAVSLSLDWKFEYNYDNYIKTDTFELSFTPSGGVACTAHFVFDNNYNPGVTYFTKDIKANETGRLTFSDPIPALSYGSHVCEMYLTAMVNDEEYRTDSIFNNITFIYNGAGTILTVPYYNKAATQYDTLKIPFMVYSPAAETCAVSFYVNDRRVGGDTYGKSLQYWPYTLADSGTIKLSIKTDNEEAQHNIELTVNKMELDVQETLNYDFSLKAKDFSSNDELREWNSNGKTLSFSENFDWENGGLKFEEKSDGSIEKYICVRQGTRMYINFDPFKVNGDKNIKFCFKTANCYDYAASFLNCYEPETNRGIRLEAQQAIFNSPSHKDGFATQYFENTYIELEVEIWPDGDDPDVNNNIYKDRFIMYWIDGVPAGVKLYAAGEKFAHINEIPIEIGSDLCDVYLYVAKSYPRRLTEDEHLDNFIVDAPSTEEMLKRYHRNDILDNTGEISYTKLIEKNPDCHAYMYDVSRMPRGKTPDGEDDIVSGCTYTELFKDNNSLDNPYYSASNVDIYAQGTSSMAYGAAAFNLRSEFPEGLIDKNKEAVEGWKVTEDAIEVDLTCTKVNVASCENCNNVVNAEWYNRFQPYHDAHRRKGLESGKAYRDTMQFETGVIFIKDNNPNDQYIIEGDIKDKTSNYLQANCFLDAERSGIPYAKNPYYKMYSIGNMGNDKKNRSIFHDTKNYNACCVEVLDNQNDKHWMTNPNVDIEDFVWTDIDDGYYEFRYSAEKYKGSDPIPGGMSKDEYARNVQAPAFLKFVKWMAENDPSPKSAEHPSGYNPTYILKAEAAEIDENTYENNVYFIQVDGKYKKAIGDFNVSETYYTISAVKPQDGDEPVEVIFDSYKFKGFNPPGYKNATKAKVTLQDFEVTEYAGTYTHDTQEYRIAKMLSECEDHLVMDSVMFHYLFIQRHTMVDNVAKNTFWSTEDLIHWDLTKDYDNDTSDGNNNSGYLTYTYGIEVLDKLEGGADIFNAGDSVWLNFCHKLYSAQAKMHQMLANEGAWDAQAYLDECKRHQNRIPERCWIQNYFHHYIRPRTLGLDVDTFLNRLEGGKKTHQRAQYEKYQEFYLNSRYLAGPGFSDSTAIDMRLNKKPSANYIQCTEEDEFSGSEVYYILTENGAYEQVVELDKETFNANKTNYYILEGQWDPNNKLTVSYYVDCYPSIHIGGQVHKSPERVKRGVTYDLPVGTMIQSANDSTCYLYGPGMLQTLTGLAKTYPSYVKLATASKLRSIAYGSDEPGYNNPNLTSLGFESNSMLQYAQAQNSGQAKGMSQVSLANAKQLQELLLNGSTLRTLILPDNGVIETIKLNALTSLTASNLTMLDVVEMDEGIYTSMDSLTVKNCPKFDEHTYRMVLNAPVTNYQLVDFKWTVNSLDELNIDENNKVVGIKVVDKLRGKIPSSDSKATSLVGEITINVDCNIDEFEIYEEYCLDYPNLIIKYQDVEGLDPAVELKFMTDDSDEALVHYRVLGSGDADGDSIAVLISNEGPLKKAIADPVRQSTTNEVFTFTGYWIDKSTGEKYNLRDFEEIVPLTSMIFYPEFTSSVRTYEVKFLDYDGNVIPQNGNDVFMVPYGSTYKAVDGPMVNFYYKDSSKLKDEERYAFRGWSTNKYGIEEIKNPVYIDLEKDQITGPLILYPHYVIENATKVASNIEYFNINGDTISLKDEYKETLQGKITIPTIVGVTKVGGFGNGYGSQSKITHIYFLADSKIDTIGSSAFAYCSEIEIINLPNTVKVINDYAFTSCSKLVTVTLNDNITIIGANAFSGCGSLQLNSLPANLITLGSGAFQSGGEGIRITVIPSGVQTLESWTFNGCPNVKITTFGGANGESNLTTIKNNCFNSAGNGSVGNAIEDIIINYSVENIEALAFYSYGYKTLKNVYFARPYEGSPPPYGVTPYDMGFYGKDINFGQLENG